MRQRFKLANEADSEQDQREREDIAFEDGQQWPVEIQAARQGQQAVNGMPAVPARPTLVIDKVKEPLQQIQNQERMADVGIQITPADDFGDLGVTPDEAEIDLREGLYRRIQRQSHAADARSWAYKRSTTAGRGYYIVRNRYLPGRTMDQEVYIDKIYNQAGVKLDPAHESDTGADAEWEFIGTWVPWDKFTSEHPKDADGKKNWLCDSDDADFVGLTEDYPEWYRQEEGEDGEKAVRVVDYWYVERVAREVGCTSDYRYFWIGEPPKDATPEEAAEYAPKGTQFIETRSVTDKTIKFVKVAGGCVELERTTEIGMHMPIVKMVGNAVLPYDTQRRYNGMIRHARGPQQAFNYMVSKLVEVIGLTPIPPLQVDPDAILGYEEWYKVAGTRALPYLPHATYDEQGRPLNKAERPNLEPNIAPIAGAAQMFDEMINSTTSVPDPMMGKIDSSVKSGKLYDAIVREGQVSTSGYFDNYKRSMIQEAAIVNGKLYDTYGTRPGRLVRVMTGELNEETVAVGAMPPQASPSLAQKAQKVAKLTKDAHFNIVAKVTQNSDARRRQFQEQYGQIIAADPAQMSIGGDLYWQNSDTPLHKQLAERQKAVLDPRVLAAIAAKENGQQVPSHELQQAQAMIQQLMQENQQLKSGVMETQMQIASDEKRQDKDLAFEQWKTQLEAGLERWKEEVRAAIEGAKIQQDAQQAQMADQTKRQDAMLRDRGSLRDTVAAAQESDKSRAHESYQGDKQAIRDNQNSEADRNFQREQQANQPTGDR